MHVHVYHLSAASPTRPGNTQKHCTHVLYMTFPLFAMERRLTSIEAVPSSNRGKDGMILHLVAFGPFLTTLPTCWMESMKVGRKKNR
jgi:hypothetical protein